MRAHLGRGLFAATPVVAMRLPPEGLRGPLMRERWRVAMSPPDQMTDRSMEPEKEEINASATFLFPELMPILLLPLLAAHF